MGYSVRIARSRRPHRELALAQRRHLEVAGSKRAERERESAADLVVATRSVPLAFLPRVLPEARATKRLATTYGVSTFRIVLLRLRRRAGRRWRRWIASPCCPPFRSVPDPATDSAISYEKAVPFVFVQRAAGDRSPPPSGPAPSSNPPLPRRNEPPTLRPDRPAARPPLRTAAVARRHVRAARSPARCARPRTTPNRRPVALNDPSSAARRVVDAPSSSPLQERIPVGPTGGATPQCKRVPRPRPKGTKAAARGHAAAKITIRQRLTRSTIAQALPTPPRSTPNRADPRGSARAAGVGGSRCSRRRIPTPLAESKPSFGRGPPPRARRAARVGAGCLGGSCRPKPPGRVSSGLPLLGQPPGAGLSSRRANGGSAPGSVTRPPPSPGRAGHPQARAPPSPLAPHAPR